MQMNFGSPSLNYEYVLPNLFSSLPYYIIGRPSLDGFFHAHSGLLYICNALHGVEKD